MGTIKYLWIAIVCSYVLVSSANAQEATRYVINHLEKYQRIEHFGASDCWSFQFIGLWPGQKVNQIADWLFSTDLDKSGKPIGIGLSLWRFNIGSGSSEQGINSKIDSPWRRSECFLTSDGTYDWTKQQGQRNFLKLAKERGVEKFLGFVYSPPVFYTQNGLATNYGRDETINLKPDYYDDFSVFLADVVDSLCLKEGIELDYVCPLNEPDGHWNWTGTAQEGTPALNTEVAKVIKETNRTFIERGLDTKILLPESSDYNCLFRIHSMTGPQRGNHVQTFFDGVNRQGVDLGGLTNVPRLLLGHSYWTTTPVSFLKEIRKELSDSLKKYDVGFWETEYCIMGNDQEVGGGPGFDPTMKTALYVARVIHHDLVFANAQSWQWWLAIGGDYKDGLLREFADSTMLDGYVQPSKLLWTMGNYSRFIRPGAERIEVGAYDSVGNKKPEGETDPTGIMVSAFKNTDGSTIVVVINYSNVDKKIDLGFSKMNLKFKAYRTSDKEGEDLLPVGVVTTDRDICILPRSVTTFVGYSNTEK